MVLQSFSVAPAVVVHLLEMKVAPSLLSLGDLMAPVRMAWEFLRASLRIESWG